jgi:hypothetical protein
MSSTDILIPDFKFQDNEPNCEKYIATVAAYHKAFKQLSDEDQEEIGQLFYNEFLKDKSEDEIQELLDLAYYADLAIKQDEIYKEVDDYTETINQKFAELEDRGPPPY